MTVERLNKGWGEQLISTFTPPNPEIPKILESGMVIAETEAKKIVYLGHPEHLNMITGRLGSSIATASGWYEDNAYAVVGTNVVYAPTHEFGATIQQGNRTIHIPARPFLIPAFESTKQMIVNHIKERLKLLLRGG